MHRIACLVGSILLFHASVATAAIQYTIINLGNLGGSYTYANALNSSGQVVGVSNVAGDVDHHAFLYSDGKMTDMGTNEAFGINDANEVVGDSTVYVRSRGFPLPFLYQGAGQIDISAGILFGSAREINSSGKIVGEIALNGDAVGRPAFYSSGNWSVLGTLGGDYGIANAINDSGQIVGGAATSQSYMHAFLYQGGTMTDLGTLGGPSSCAYGINQSGAVVGQADVDRNSTAFLYENGRMKELEVFAGASQGVAYGINNRGMIVGEADGRAAIWENGKISDLNQLIPPDFAIHLGEARGINDSGEIICNGTQGSRDEHAFLLVPGVTVPIVEVQGRIRRENSLRHITIQGTAKKGPIKYVTFHVGRSRFHHGSPSHPGAPPHGPRYATGTDAWSLSTALRPGKNYITVVAHGSYGDSHPVTVVVIQK